MVSLNESLGIIIVTYGIAPESCTTLSSFMANQHHLDGISLSIYVRNNGPVSYQSSLSIPNLVYSESIDNVSLAKIYNQAIEAMDCDYYLILDHDSFLNEEFLSEVSRFVRQNKEDVLFPFIKSKDVIRYPRISRELVANPISANFNRPISTITSGMVLSRDLINQVKIYFGSVFDERFILYGVDSSFLLRLRKTSDKHKLKFRVAGTLQHSLSSDENESEKMKLFRSTERLYDLALQTRYYFRVRILYIIIRDLCKAIFLQKNIRPIFIFLHVIVSGKHPRNFN